MSVLLIDGWYDLHKSMKNFDTIDKKIRPDEKIADRKELFLQEYSNNKEGLKGCNHCEKCDECEKCDQFPITWHIKPQDFMNIIFVREYFDKESYYYAANAAKFDFIQFFEEVPTDYKLFKNIFIDKTFGVSKEEEKRYDGLLKYVRQARNCEALETIRKRMVQLLEMSEQRNRDLCNKVIEHMNGLETDAREEEWMNAIYIYIFFATNNCLPTQMAFDEYANIKSDMREYNAKITMEYGCSGVPGMIQIYNMANRENPNIIALFEMGEMEYYGKGRSNVPDYNKAYDYYAATVRLNKAHPLALWSIAFMKYNYKKKGKGLENAVIEQLEYDYPENRKNGNPNIYLDCKINWYNDIISKAIQSYNYNCAAAANLIGQLLDDKDVPAGCLIKSHTELANRDSKYFYKKSADRGYVYGCNNYALICMKEAQNCESKSERIVAANEAIEYYKKAADLGETYAMNTLAGYYFEGLKIRGNVILKKDEKLAYDYYLKALNLSGFNKYYWPFINLCERYWLVDDKKYTYYGDSDITMNEIERLLLEAVQNVEKIGQLQGLKRVYDVIMKTKVNETVQEEIRYKERILKKI